MSANGTFSSTLDYDFFGGGYITIQGGVSGSIDPAISSTSKVYIVGESTNNSIDFTFSSAAQMPPAQGTLEQTIDFTFSSTVEFGIIRWATANNRIDFSLDTAEGYNLTHGNLNKTLPFFISITADQFSLADTTVSYDFVLSGKGINISTHTYDRIGTNGVTFRDNYNGISIVDQFTDVNIRDNGSTSVRILSPV